MFHYGILFVLAGHLVGLFVPDSWTSALGVSETTYHDLSLYGGTLAGLATVAGIALLIYRRRTNGPVFLATTRNDKLMYAVLLAAIVMGMTAKLTHAGGHGYDYRTTIAPWLRSVFTLRPDYARMNGVPVTYQIHIVIGCVLIALVPYTRLIHMFSAPVQYLFRPYIVYRSRERGQLGTRSERPGWERVQ